MKTQAHQLPPEARRMRADKALAEAFPEHSRAALQRAFDADQVWLAGKAIARDHPVRGGDSLSFALPDARPSELRAVKLPLDVLKEDRHLIVINKAAGMVVHPGAATEEDTLVHALLAHCGDSLSGIGGVERPGIVHRLDRETSGLMIVAKTDRAHVGLAEQFSARTTRKEYLALVEGQPELLSGSIRQPIGRHPRHRHKMTVMEAAGKGRSAHTDWEVVEKFGGIATLVRCVLHTGRTHQIRVHLKALGHPLLGDVVYGWKADPRLGKDQPPRVMLHAEHLIVKHPVTGKVLDLHAPLPKDFEKMMRVLRKVGRSKG